MNIYEIIKISILSIPASMQADGVFDWIIRRQPKRVVAIWDEDTNMERFYPQWEFFGWHFDWIEDGYDHIKKISYEKYREAVKHAIHMGEHKEPPKVKVMFKVDAKFNEEDLENLWEKK